MESTKDFQALRKKAELIAKKNKKLANQTRFKFEAKALDHELSLYQIELEIQNEKLLQIQKDLDESRHRYAELYNCAPIGYFTLDSANLICDVNDVGVHLLGFSKNSLIKKNFTRYIASDYQFIFSDFKQRILNTVCIQSCELKLLKKNGPLFYAQLEGKVLLNTKTGNKNILIIITDITLNKQAKDNFQPYPIANSDRQNPASELAVTIAHELNHPHAVISNYIHGAITRLENGELQKTELLQALKKTMDQLNRANEIILRIENFMCRGTLKFERVNLDILIKEVLTFINHEIGNYHIMVHYQPLNFSLEVTLDRIHIQQVMLNLARNAIEAMNDAGSPDPKLIIAVNLINKKTVQVSILDNGPGFDTRVVHRFFDPHFTTKPYGLGLGLAISRAVIEAHQGQLIAEPNFPSGSCFKFMLPLKIND